MNQNEVISMIGDRIVELDELRGSVPPDDPQRKQLDDFRKALDDYQRRLAQKQFDENTEGYREATQKLATANAQLVVTIADITKLEDTISNLNRFLGAIDTVAEAAVGAFA